MKTQGRLIGVLIAVLLMTVLLVAPGVLAGAKGPDALDMPSVTQSTTYTLWDSKAITASTSLTYTMLNTRSGYWAMADVFVTTVGNTGTITVTPQYSADGTNWVDADYTYLSNSFTTSVITGTAGLTATTSSATSLATGNYQIVLSTSTTAQKRVPIVGDYLRYKIANTGVVTVTIKETMKNAR